jgi:hypothetical protein
MTTETATAGASEAAGTTVMTAPAAEPAPAAAPETKPEGAAPAAAAAGDKPPEGELKAEGEAKEGDKPAGAPEEYADFTLPEGFTADGPVLTDFKATAKEMGLTQDAAQKVVDLGAKLVEQTQQQMRDAWAQTTAKWVDTIKTDPEIGGAQMNERVAVAVKALDKFGTPELRAALNETGMGNHPEVVRFFHRVGLAISEDTLVTSNTKAAAPKDAAEVLYGSNG